MNRRTLLKQSLGVMAAGVASSKVLGAVAQSGFSKSEAIACLDGPTAAQTSGPFYPVNDQADKDNDLTIVRGHTREALGERIVVYGQLTDQHCVPVANALVEIWQACYSGRYSHPQDTNSAPLDPDFQYWGQAITNANGDYVFKTIVPGAYPADTDWVRPPHIHFRVAKLGYKELITQLYFAEFGQLNSKDKIWNDMSGKAQITVTIPIVRSAAGSGQPGQVHFPIQIKRL